MANPTPGPSDAPPQPEVDINDVFSLRKPKDAKAGLASGLKSAAKGVIGGAAGLIAAPLVGASREGVVGFAKGVVTGVATAVVLPVAGIGVGLVQLGRGVANTPTAIMESSKGKVWDEEQRCWIDQPGTAIVTVDERNRAQQDQLRALTQRGDSDFYDLLEVPRTATPEQIKKQYYILARKYHPDKNPNDPEAHAKFQKLGEAYQVLANPDLRERYDRNGAEGLDVNLMDGSEFFNMLFGNQLFEYLVGELIIAAAARSGGELTQTELKNLQFVRVEKLAQNLRALLQRYVEGDQEGFRLAMVDEAKKLVAASFGEVLLLTIGKVYETQADIANGGFFDGIAARWRQQGDAMKSQFQAASAAIKVYQAQQRLEQWQREYEKKLANQALAKAQAAKEAEKAAREAEAAKEAEAEKAAKTGEEGASSTHTPAETATPPPAAAPAVDPAEEYNPYEDLMQRQKMEEATLPLMLEAMWAANVLDIQTTLRKVCKKVLVEDPVDKQVLKARAMALRELGQIFQNTKADQTPGEETKDAKQQMEDAMKRVLEKRQAADTDQSTPESSQPRS